MKIKALSVLIAVAVCILLVAIVMVHGASAAPTLVVYTISNRTITPPQTTEIDVAFSEEVSWTIAIQKDATTVYDWTGTNTTTGLSVVNNTETITVLNMREF